MSSRNEPVHLVQTEHPGRPPWLPTAPKSFLIARGCLGLLLLYWEGWETCDSCLSSLHIFYHSPKPGIHRCHRHATRFSQAHLNLSTYLLPPHRSKETSCCTARHGDGDLPTWGTAEFSKTAKKPVKCFCRPVTPPAGLGAPCKAPSCNLLNGMQTQVSGFPQVWAEQMAEGQPGGVGCSNARGSMDASGCCHLIQIK